MRANNDNSLPTMAGAEKVKEKWWTKESEFNIDDGTVHFNMEVLINFQWRL